ncbi:MAG TPA: redoxin domain-containing protein [Planctomycetaceae bacterium]|jgi:peroxiredoxin|nr:redoxin domain-containing protein [Planctomycetaceae bacterium]
MSIRGAWRTAAAICALVPALAAGGERPASVQTAWPAHRASQIQLVQNDAASREVAVKKGQDPKPEPPPLKKLTVRVLDRDGNPVVGAHVGLGAHFGALDEPKKSDGTDADGFVYEWHRLTNSRGVAEIEAGGADLRTMLEDQGIVAREEKRHLVAITYADGAKVKDQLEVILAPECRVTGKVMCPELKKDEKPLGSTTVSLGDGDHVALTYASETGVYHFFVPPGEYLLDAGGSNIFRVFASIAVPPKEHDLVFEPMIATPSKLALLEGQPAPELRGAVAWKNGPSLTISSLKGKCVVLFFWRASSPDSLAAVPALVDLYEKLKKYGLVVIGVDVDVDQQKRPVDSVQKLDEMLVNARKEAWGGRDIPFPVAIVPPALTPFGEKFHTRQFADSPASADYGVTQYPTVLLINRQGVLVNELDDSDQSLALLEKTLGLRLSPTPRKPAKPAPPPPPTKNPAHSK